MKSNIVKESSLNGVNAVIIIAAGYFVDMFSLDSALFLSVITSL